jgi:hypothetical protein
MEVSAAERLERMKEIAAHIDAADDIDALKAQLLELCKVVIGEIESNNWL